MNYDNYDFGPTFLNPEIIKNGGDTADFEKRPQMVTLRTSSFKEF
jgi:hypothetical protein